MINAPDISLYSHACPVDHAGTVLQISGWKCDNALQVPVVCLHDLGETSALYRGALELLATNGGSAYGFDMRRSGAIGVKSMRVLQRDLLQVIALVKHHEAGEAPVLLANGLSAVIAIRLALTYPKLVSGLILVDPPHPEATAVSRLRLGATRFLAEILPDVKLPSRLLSAKRIIRAQNAGSMAPVAAHELVEAVAEIPGQLAKLPVRCRILVSSAVSEELWLKDVMSLSGAGTSCEVVLVSAGAGVFSGSLPVHIMCEWLRK